MHSANLSVALKKGREDGEAAAKKKRQDYDIQHVLSRKLIKSLKACIKIVSL